MKHSKHSRLLVMTPLLACWFASGLACGGAVVDSTGLPHPADSDAGAVEGPRGWAPGAGGTEPSPAPNTPSNALAVDASVVRIRIDEVVLGGIPKCAVSSRPVEYERASRTMLWPGCSVADAGSLYVDASGSDYPPVTRQLTAAEAARVDNALTALTYEANPLCEHAYDGLEYFMRTYDAAGVEVVYSAGNINCYGHRRASRLPALYALFKSLL